MEDFKETERRRNGGTVFNEPYSQQGVYRFKHLVQQFYERNERKYYSILVDGEMVIKKTYDSRKFEGYQDFINDFTKKVEVRIFTNDHPNSPNCNRYIFRIGGALAGISSPTIDVNEEIKKALQKQRQEDELGKLRKKVVKLQKELEKAPKVDWDRMFEKALGAIAMIKGKSNQLSGVSQTQNHVNEVTVDLEGDDESSMEMDNAQIIFNALIEKQGIENVLRTLEVLKVIGENPEIGKKVNQMLNNKK